MGSSIATAGAGLVAVLALLAVSAPSSADEPADIILRHGKVITVDRAFSIREAIAIRGERILRVGSDDEVLRTKGPATEVIDLEGRAVIPGLIDSHAHPLDASLTELDHPIPQMDSIAAVLEHIRGRAAALPAGEWILVSQVFITRLAERRYPTREELDRAAPRHPIVFATGPDASLNTLALQLSGIGRDTAVTDGGPGFIEKDPRTGEPTGILRSCTRIVKSKPSGRTPSAQERADRVAKLFADYNSVGITSIADADASSEGMETYAGLLERGRLTVRIYASRHLDTSGPLEGVLERARAIAREPLRKGGPMLRVGGVKAYLDGGMLTGSAYMRAPWGVSAIYGITDPSYRGVLFIPRDRLLPIVRAVAREGLQFTAHTVGDGAVEELVSVYGELSKEMDLRATRPSISHSNFLFPEAVQDMARLGIVANIQPAWLHLDAATLTAQFGDARLRWFQPLRSLFEAGAVVGGGSDHMQKIGSFRSVNPYNPFLGIWITVTRTAKGLPEPLHPEERLTREQALRFYTANNAWLLFQEDRTGTLEEGKLADLAVLDRDILTCPIDDVPRTQVLRTYLGGKKVFPR